MRAVLIVDVDGVVSPVRGRTAWGDDVDGGMGRTPVSPTLNRRLDALGARPDVQPLWLTSWDSEMRQSMRFPGIDWATLVRDRGGPDRPPASDEAAMHLRSGARRSDNTWWKWWALEEWLDHHPDVDTVAWCDDHLAKPFFSFHDAYDVKEGVALTRSVAAAVELERRGLRALLIAPDAKVGLTPADLDRLDAFLDDPSVAPPRPRMPRDLSHPARGGEPMTSGERQTRRCGFCDPDVWYLRYSPTFIDCTVCHRTYYGKYDVTEHVVDQSQDRS